MYVYTKAVVTAQDMNTRKTAEQLDAVASFVERKNFPEHLGRRIRRHFRHVYSLKTAIDENKIFTELSTSLRAEVSDYLLEKNLWQVTLFRSMSRTLWPRLLPQLRPVHFDREDLLCSQGEAVALSIDHKPTRPSERRRILAGGGTVTHCNGAARVNGCLSCSRAIGDRSLKPHVSPEPELKEWQLGPNDEFVILASDGLWDVFTNDEAGGCGQLPKIITTVS